MSPPAALTGADEVTAVTDTTGVTIPDPTKVPLRSNEIYGRRKQTGKGQWGTAAPSHSNNFRSGSQEGKPFAKRWDKYLSTESASRGGNSLKQAAKYLSKPGLISLGGGLPSSEYFPFDELSITTPTPPHFGEADIAKTGTRLTAGKHDLAQDKGIFDIATAFNYGQGTGAAQLLRWVTEHTELVHSPPYADWSCTLSVGSTSALGMVLRMLSQPGDLIISEEYTFATAVETAHPMGVKVLGVAMDKEGMLPDALDEVLSGWDREARGGARKPFLLYTVPTGQNPTGATQGIQRRRALYAVAQKHDLIIIEDEPYYFLQMQPYTGVGAAEAPLPKSHEEFLQSLVPSYLSFDVDGRVLRMDSFSKVVTPGSRVGWITAPDQLVERYRRHADVSTQGPSGISQLVLFKLLDEHWGHEGYLDWLVHIRVEYTNRRNSILEACEKYLPKDLVSWHPPAAGMFHWLCIKPPASFSTTLSVKELEERLFLASIDEGALAMRGSWFYADASMSRPDIFFRMTYASAPAEKIHEAVRRFGEAVRKTFGVEENGTLENGVKRQKR